MDDTRDGYTLMYKTSLSWAGQLVSNTPEQFPLNPFFLFFFTMQQITLIFWRILMVKK